eukprot:6492002-Amphidinium_carterae.2
MKKYCPAKAPKIHRCCAWRAADAVDIVHSAPLQARDDYSMPVLFKAPSYQSSCHASFMHDRSKFNWSVRHWIELSIAAHSS